MYAVVHDSGITIKLRACSGPIDLDTALRLLGIPRFKDRGPPQQDDADAEAATNPLYVMFGIVPPQPGESEA